MKEKIIIKCSGCERYLIQNGKKGKDAEVYCPFCYKISKEKSNKVILSGCGAKNGDEIDGWEFDVEDLHGFMEILNSYWKQDMDIHLNFYGDENVDLWITKHD